MYNRFNDKKNMIHFTIIPVKSFSLSHNQTRFVRLPI